MGDFTTIAVRNGGGFVVSFFVEATAEGQPWKVESGNFGANDSHTVQVPADAVDIALSVHGEKFIDDWHHILNQSWGDTSSWPSTGLQYHTWGTADAMHCALESTAN